MYILLPPATLLVKIATICLLYMWLQPHINISIFKTVISTRKYIYIYDLYKIKSYYTKTIFFFFFNVVIEKIYHYTTLILLDKILVTIYKIKSLKIRDFLVLILNLNPFYLFYEHICQNFYLILKWFNNVRPKVMFWKYVFTLFNYYFILYLTSKIFT